MFEITSEEIEILCRINMEYFYLGSLISSDKILTIEDAKKGLEYIGNGEKAVENAKISDEKKKEFYNYFKKAKRILRHNIEEFKKQQK